MFKSYLKIAVRNLLKHKTFSFINLFGLAVGFASAIFILLYVQNELSYDRFHKDADSIYRLDSQLHINDFNITTPNTSLGLIQYLGDNYRNVKTATKIDGGSTPFLFSYNNKKTYEDNVIYADNNFLKVFSFKMLKGNPENALKEPASVILNEEIANKYFGDENPLGKIIKISSLDTTISFKVTGVIENDPINSSLQYSAICSFITFNPPVFVSDKKNWENLNILGYVKLTDPSFRTGLDKIIAALPKQFLGKGPYYKPFLQPLTDIHLNTLGLDIPAEGVVGNLYIYSGLAILMLLIAAINYMNLVTSKATTRVKEIGIKKVLGANRKSLLVQFLSESIILSVVSALLALFLVEMLMPVYNNILNSNIKLSILNQSLYIAIFALIVLFTGIIAGSYPALYLSGFMPVEVLKNNTNREKRRGLLRKILVVIQFTGSLALLMIAFGIQKQLNLFYTKDIGIDKKDILVIPLHTSTLASNADELKNELKELSIVKGVTIGAAPIADQSTNVFRLQTESGEIKTTVCMEAVDYDFADVFKPTIVDGNWFSDKFTSEADANFVVNQSFVDKFGLINPVGLKMSAYGIVPDKGRIIGVVKDFNYASLKSSVEPLAMWIYKKSKFWQYQVGQVSIKMAGGITTNSIEAIHKVWKKVYPDVPFSYNIFAALCKKNYETENKFGEIIGVFTLIALLTAALGLFGIASFTAERRSKEIGIRKVLGAGVNSIVLLITRDFIKLVLIANLIAIPIAYYLINRWLQNFAYRTSVSAWLFLTTAILSILIALFAISFQSIKAALTNPVNVLKNE